MATGKKDQTRDKIDIDKDFDLERFDFSAMDDQFDEGVNKPDDRSAVRKVFTGAVTGMKDEIFSKKFVEKRLEEALPEKYGVISEDINRVTGTVENVYNDSVNKLKPQLAKIARRVDKLVPQESKFFRGIADKFKELTDADNSAYQGESIETQRANLVSNDIAAIFAAQQESEVEEKAREAVKEDARDVADQERHLSNFGVLSTISQNIARVANYTDKINMGFQKKSLELQYRSFFAQQDLLNTTKQFFNIFKTQNEGVIKNTSLPEYVKITSGERIKDVLKTKLAGSVHDKLFSGDNMLKRGLANIKDKIGYEVQNASDMLENFEGMMDQMQNANDMLVQFGGDRTQMLGELAGGELTGKFFSKIFKELRPDSEKHKGLNEKLYNMSDALQNPKKFLDNILDTHQITVDGQKMSLRDANGIGKGTTLGGLMQKATESFSNYDLNQEHTVIGREQIGSLDSPAPTGITRRMQLSLTDVLPGYMARIHSEIFALRADSRKIGEANYKPQHYGDKTSIFSDKLTVSKPTVTYDYASGKFSETSTVISNIRSTMRKSLNQYEHASRLNTIISDDNLAFDGLEKPVQVEVMNFFNELSHDETGLSDAITDITKYKPFLKIKNKKAKVAILNMFKKMNTDDEKGLASTKKMEFTGNMEKLRKSVQTPTRDIQTAASRYGTEVMADALDHEELKDMLKVDRDETKISGKRVLDRVQNKSMESVLTDRTKLIDHSKLNSSKNNDLAKKWIEEYKLEDRVRGMDEQEREWVKAKSRVTKKEKNKKTPDEVEIRTLKEAYEKRIENITKLTKIKITDPKYKALEGYFTELRKVFQREYDQFMQKYPASDINVKTDIKPISESSALKSLMNTKISSWFYKKGKGPEGKAIGPMAQDVQKNMGNDTAPDGRALDIVRMNGINMAAIKELGSKYLKLEDVSNQILTRFNKWFSKKPQEETSAKTVNVNIEQPPSGDKKPTDDSSYSSKIVDGNTKWYKTSKAKTRIHKSKDGRSVEESELDGKRSFRLVDDDTSDVKEYTAKDGKVYIHKKVNGVWKWFRKDHEYKKTSEPTTAEHPTVSDKKPTLNQENTGHINTAKPEIDLNPSMPKTGEKDKRSVIELMQSIDLNTYNTANLISKGKGGMISMSPDETLYKRGDGYQDALSNITRGLWDIGTRGLGDFFTGLSKGAKKTSDMVGSGVDSAKKGAKYVSDEYGEDIKEGGKWVLEKGLGLVKGTFTTLTSAFTDTLPKAISSIKKFGKRVFDAMSEHLFGNSDIYDKLGIRRIPEMWLKAGKVIDSATGKTITTLAEVYEAKGDLVNTAGEILLTVEERAEGIFDKHGKILKTKLTKAVNIAVGAGILAAKGIGKFAKKLGETGAGAAIMGSKLVKGTLDQIKKYGGRLFGDFSTISFPGLGFIGAESHNVLVDIRGILNDRLPGEKKDFTQGKKAETPKTETKPDNKAKESDKKPEGDKDNKEEPKEGTITSTVQKVKDNLTTWAYQQGNEFVGPKRPEDSPLAKMKKGFFNFLNDSEKEGENVTGNKASSTSVSTEQPKQLGFISKLASLIPPEQAEGLLKKLEDYGVKSGLRKVEIGSDGKRIEKVSDSTETPKEDKSYLGKKIDSVKGWFKKDEKQQSSEPIETEKRSIFSRAIDTAKKYKDSAQATLTEYNKSKPDFVGPMRPGEGALPERVTKVLSSSEKAGEKAGGLLGSVLGLKKYIPNISDIKETTKNKVEELGTKPIIEKAKEKITNPLSNLYNKIKNKNREAITKYTESRNDFIGPRQQGSEVDPKYKKALDAVTGLGERIGGIVGSVKSVGNRAIDGLGGKDSITKVVEDKLKPLKGKLDVYKSKIEELKKKLDKKEDKGDTEDVTSYKDANGVIHESTTKNGETTWSSSKPKGLLARAKEKVSGYMESAKNKAQTDVVEYNKSKPDFVGPMRPDEGSVSSPTKAAYNTAEKVGKVAGRVGGFFGGIKDKISNKITDAKEKGGGLLGTALGLAGKFGGPIGKAVALGASLLGGLGSGGDNVTKKPERPVEEVELRKSSSKGTTSDGKQIKGNINVDDNSAAKQKALEEQRQRNSNAANGGGGTGSGFDLLSSLFSGVARGIWTLVKFQGKILKGIINFVPKLLKGVRGMFSGLGNALSKIPLVGGAIGRALGFGGRVLTGVRTAAMVAGSMGGAGGALGATAIAAATYLAPIALVGGAAYLGWRAYKSYTRDKIDEFRKIRFTQYGLESVDSSKDKSATERIKQLVDLEELMIDKGVTMKPSGYEINSSYVNSGEGSKAILDIFDYTRKDMDANPDLKEKFANWLDKRFSPVFIRSMSAAMAISKDKKMLDVSSFTPNEKMSYLAAIDKDDGESEILSSPFKTLQSLSDCKALSKSSINELRSKVEKELSKGEENKNAESKIAKEKADEKAALERKEKEAREKTLAPDKPLNNSPTTPPQVTKPNISTSPTQPQPIQTAIPTKPAPILTSTTLSDSPSGNNSKPKVETPVIKKSAVATNVNGRIDPDEVIQKVSVGGSKHRLEGVNPGVVDKYLSLATDYKQTTGQKLKLTDGFRTREDQDKVYQQKIAAGKIGEAAPPGHSPHEVGLALDTDGAQMNKAASMGLLDKHGFARPLLYAKRPEPWHIEPVEIQANRNSIIRAENAKNNAKIEGKGIDKTTAAANSPQFNIGNVDTTPRPKSVIPSVAPVMPPPKPVTNYNDKQTASPDIKPETKNDSPTTQQVSNTNTTPRPANQIIPSAPAVEVNQPRPRSNFSLTSVMSQPARNIPAPSPYVRQTSSDDMYSGLNQKVDTVNITLAESRDTLKMMLKVMEDIRDKVGTSDIDAIKKMIEEKPTTQQVSDDKDKKEWSMPNRPKWPTPAVDLKRKAYA